MNHKNPVNFEVKSLIYSKHRTEAELAEVLGWKRQKLNRFTTGQSVPSLPEVYELAMALDTSLEDLAYMFLKHKAPTPDAKQAGQ